MRVSPPFGARLSLSRLVYSANSFIGDESNAFNVCINLLIFLFCCAFRRANVSAPLMKRVSANILFPPARCIADRKALSAFEHTRAGLQRTSKGRAVFNRMFCHHWGVHESTVTTMGKLECVEVEECRMGFLQRVQR